MKVGVLAAISVALAVGAGSADAFCVEPNLYASPPDAPGTYLRPSAPYCLSGFKYTGNHDCSHYEIDSYISEINSYISKLNQFATEANEFASQASQYANEAFDYVRCEAADAKSELN